jgi:hypothetical protein
MAHPLFNINFNFIKHDFSNIFFYICKNLLQFHYAHFFALVILKKYNLCKMPGVGRPRRTAQSNLPAGNIPIEKPMKLKN